MRFYRVSVPGHAVWSARKMDVPRLKRMVTQTSFIASAETQDQPMPRVEVVDFEPTKQEILDLLNRYGGCASAAGSRADESELAMVAAMEVMAERRRREEDGGSHYISEVDAAKIALSVYRRAG